MTANGWLQIIALLLATLAVTKPLGIFMARVFNREKTFLDPVLRPVERLIYQLTGVDERQEMISPSSGSSHSHLHKLSGERSRGTAIE